MINQPHAFEALQHGMYYQRARDRERRLAQRVVNGERNWPAKYSLDRMKTPDHVHQLGIISRL
jgi:N-acetylmuramoyl-L-alanine amidase